MTDNADPGSSALPGQVSDYQPRSFRERGVAAPFTTPVLSGGRVRISARQTAEVIVCNPSGGRSVYILPLSAITEICAPTLHDRALQAEILQLPVLTPGAMRVAARRVAVSGAGGRGSMQKATEATPRLQAAQIRAQAGLREGVMREGVIGGNAPLHDIGLLPKLFGCQEIVLEQRLIALANLLAELGIYGAEACNSPTAARRVAQIAAFATAVAECQSGISGRLGRAVAELVQDATIAHATAHAILHEAMAMTEAPSILLRRFIHETIGITQLLSRIDWLLDGWDRICLLWQDAREASGRPMRTTLQEMVLHAPRLPSEAHDWIPRAAAANATLQALDANVVTEDERNTSSRQIGPGEIIARNERIAAELAAA